MVSVLGFHFYPREKLYGINKWKQAFEGNHLQSKQATHSNNKSGNKIKTLSIKNCLHSLNSIRSGTRNRHPLKPKAGQWGRIQKIASYILAIAEKKKHAKLAQPCTLDLITIKLESKAFIIKHYIRKKNVCFQCLSIIWVWILLPPYLLL